MDSEIKAILNELKEGNRRFAEARPKHPNQSRDRLSEVAKGQHPKAIVLGCSDSRVPPEIVFDQGLGDVFAVRVAGNILNDENIGSIEYAADHMGTKVIVVLGHNRCGAVTAAVKGAHLHGHVENIVKKIGPAVSEARKEMGPKANDSDVLNSSVRINVERTVKELKSSEPILKNMAEEGNLIIVGAIYNVDTGVVEWLE